MQVFTRTVKTFSSSCELSCETQEATTETLIVPVLNSRQVCDCALIAALYKLRHEKTGFFWLGENRGADQLRSICKADQRLCFHYMDSRIPILSDPKFPAFSHLL